MPSSIRRVTSFGAALVAFALTALPAWALSVTVDGQPVGFNPPPISRAGRVFVPLRGVFERLGASVVYDRGVINATGNNHAISLRIGSTQATIDGQPRPVDVAPFVVGASTYVPLRFVSEALGAGVNYDAANQIVALTTNGQAAQGPAPAGATPPSYGMGTFLRNIQPSRGTSVAAMRPAISADFAQAADPNSVRISLDGADVSASATRSSSGFIYAPPSPLQSIKHTVSVSGRLAGGGSFDDRWSFTSGTVSATNNLTIAGPADGSTVSSTFDVTGHTVPGARVHIVAGATAGVGGFFTLGAGSYSGDLQADASGNFSQSVSLQTVSGASIALTVTSTDPQTKASAQKKLQLHAQ